MINNANKALGYAEVYYNYRTEKFFTDAVGNEFLELDISLGDGGSDSSTLDDVTDRGSTTTNDITIGRLTASKIGLPSFSSLPTTNLNFGDLCALTSDNRPYFYDGTDWRKLYLVDVPPAAGDPDTDWDQVILRATFDSNLNDLSDSSHASDHDSGSVRVGSPKKFGTNSVKLDSSRLFYESVSPFLTSAFTIEFWLYLDSYQSGSGDTVVSLMTYGTTTFQYETDSSDTTNQISFQLYVGSTVTTFVSDTDFSKQRWYHIAYTRNASTGVITLYIDGSSVGTVSGNNISSISSTYLIVGDSYNGDMFVDDLRISTFERYTSDFTAPTTALPTSD
jgi:hypothetical protein